MFARDSGFSLIHSAMISRAPCKCFFKIINTFFSIDKGSRGSRFKIKLFLIENLLCQRFKTFFLWLHLRASCVLA